MSSAGSHSISQLPSQWLPLIQIDQQRCIKRSTRVFLCRASHSSAQNSKNCGSEGGAKQNLRLCVSLGAGILSGAAFQFASPVGGGGSAWLGGSGRGGGGGGRGRGGSGDFWSRFGVAFAASTEDDSLPFDHHGLPPGMDVPIDKLSSIKRYKVASVEIIDMEWNKKLRKDDPLAEFFVLRPNEVYRKEQLEQELTHLRTSGMFDRVNLEAVTLPDGTIKAKFSFYETYWIGADKLSCMNVGLLRSSGDQQTNLPVTEEEKAEATRKRILKYMKRVRSSRASLIPSEVLREVKSTCLKSSLTSRMLQQIRDGIQRWYHENGYVCAQVVNFGNLNTKHIFCELVEGDITDLVVQFQDKMGYPMEGSTDEDLVRREIPEELAPGHVFNIEAGKQALRNLNSLGLFSNIEINPRPDEQTEGGIIVEVKLKELEPKTAEVNTEWSIVPGRGGRPALASIQPGGSVTIEHRNIKGLNRSLIGTVTSSNLFNPQEDLGFKMEYVHPYLDGIGDPRNRVFRASCFNSRKLSPVFTGGPGLEEVPAIWVDRSGVKSTITNNLTRQSKLTYGLVLERVTTRDETYTVCTNGARALPSGALSMDGPPTTLSGTGIDHLVFFQANITRDNTRFVNGTPVGARDVFQLDQGIGIGSKLPLFNRHQLALTRFIQLKRVYEGAGYASPPVLVLHGHYGGCIGDLPSYDAFTLGGPYSVRGYNMGELGACRNILEVAGELRVPLRGSQAYVFAEYGTDLGSSKLVKGNPTEFFRRAGHGSSYGVGLKLGLMRAEYAIDGNAGIGSILVRFGERF
eukprot:TRINITY_DN33063_c0_g1_i1.p1 TRINITY_DN33063_c0_g1~~TRINITY_DN33063_c0_g1_i1.p1  ORF type:complete len:799 (+),score=141.39 TRINITY_DN33063_c0_g1_i1:214-2610(+)